MELLTTVAATVGWYVVVSVDRATQRHPIEAWDLYEDGIAVALIEEDGAVTPAYAYGDVAGIYHPNLRPETPDHAE
jgi:hypothetical protein